MNDLINMFIFDILWNCLHYYLGITLKKAFQKLHNYHQNLQSQANTNRITLIMHTDGTYKTNTAEYEVYPIGYTDANGIFFPLAFFISSHKD